MSSNQGYPGLNLNSVPTQVPGQLPGFNGGGRQLQTDLPPELRPPPGQPYSTVQTTLPGGSIPFDQLASIFGPGGTGLPGGSASQSSLRQFRYGTQLPQGQPQGPSGFSPHGARYFNPAGIAPPQNQSYQAPSYDMLNQYIMSMQRPAQARPDLSNRPYK